MLPIPIGTDRPQRHLPWMNYALIAANVVFYFLSHHLSRGLHAGASGLSPDWDRFLLTPTHLRLEQFITYQFLHEGLAHIFFNMLFLYVLGNNLNEKLGNLGYLAFYLAGGVLAGCGQVLTSNAPTLGASGAISAVAGMFLVLLPRTNIRIFLWIFVYVDVWEIPSVYFILFSVAKDFLGPLLWGDDRTAHAAHLSGNVAGFVIGLFLLLTRLVQRDHYDLLAQIDRWRRRKQYESMVAGGYDPFALAPSSRIAQTEPAPPADPRLLQLREEIGDLVRRHDLPGAVAKYLQLRAIDPRQVLASTDQLDIANQLMSEQRYVEAAVAYEDYLRIYTTGHQHDQIMVLLGLIYARHLHRFARAVELYRAALPRLHDPSQRRWVEEELTHLQSALPPPSPA